MQAPLEPGILTGVADLVSAIAWPGILAFGVYHFRTEVKAFLRNLSEISLKAGSFEASAKRSEAAAALGAAEAAKQSTLTETDAPAASSAGRSRSIAATVESAARPTTLRRLASSVVLWVDDRPSNNTYERRALEAVGVRFTFVASTDEAMQALAREQFDAVISDMARAGDSDAGLTLIKEMRRRAMSVPVIIYAGNVAVKKRQQIVQTGAFGSTNSPQELFELVTRAITEG